MLKNQQDRQMNIFNMFLQIPFLRKCWRTNRTGKWFLIPSWRLSICVLRLNFVESVLNSAVQGPKYPIHAKFRDRSTHSRTIMSGPKYLIHDQGPKYLIHAKFWGLKSSFTIRDPSTLFTHNFQGLKSSFTFRDPSTLFTQHFCVLKSSFTFRDWNTSFTQGLKSPFTIRERNTGAPLNSGKISKTRTHYGNIMYTRWSIMKPMSRLYKNRKFGNWFSVLDQDNSALLTRLTRPPNA